MTVRRAKIKDDTSLDVSAVAGHHAMPAALLLKSVIVVWFERRRCKVTVNIDQNTVELQWLEHWWLVYHGCFEHVLESPWKKKSWLQIWDHLVWFFFFILKTVYCMFSLESPQWGDSNENTEHTSMLLKNQRNRYYASWPCTIINPHWLELPLSRTNFNGP